MRYWVTLEKECIYLRNLQNINIETIKCIPLNNLVQVYQPLEKEEEKYKIIFQQPEHGIVLIFNNDYDITNQSSIQNRKTEKEESKKSSLNNNKYYMYLCAESSKKATLWRTAFNVFTSAHCI